MGWWTASGAFTSHAEDPGSVLVMALPIVFFFPKSEKSSYQLEVRVEPRTSVFGGRFFNHYTTALTDLIGHISLCYFTEVMID